MSEFSTLEISPEKLAGGVYLEEMLEAFREVIVDIQSLDKHPDKVRKATFEFRFKPNSDRKTVQVSMQPTTKLAQKLPYETRIEVGKDESGAPITSTVICDGEGDDAE
jgi:hypothetical protein